MLTNAYARFQPIITSFCTRQLVSSAIRMEPYKIEKSKMNLVITSELTKLVSYFDRYNHEIRIAGGAVRDLLSGEKIPDDIDLATTATPQEMLDMLIDQEQTVRVCHYCHHKF